MNLPLFVAIWERVSTPFNTFQHPDFACIAFQFYGSLRVVKVVPSASTCDYVRFAKAGGD
jgi:hypothetical protein